MEIGVRELKEHLSEYLERAAAGEHLTVTDRGRSKAVLGPVTGGDHIARGIEQGWITPARSPGPIPPAPGSSQGVDVHPRDDRRGPRRRMTFCLDSSALLKRYIDEPDGSAPGTGRAIVRVGCSPRLIPEAPIPCRARASYPSSPATAEPFSDSVASDNLVNSSGCSPAAMIASSRCANRWWGSAARHRSTATCASAPSPCR